jgi:hypothetical protein
MELLFTCAICSRDVTDYPDRNGRDRHLAPLCRRCEQEGQRVQWAGTFMDRRRLQQISAISDALLGEAHMKIWSHSYGSA